MRFYAQQLMQNPSFSEAPHAPDYIGNGSARETALLLTLPCKSGRKQMSRIIISKELGCVTVKPAAGGMSCHRTAARGCHRITES